MMQCTEAHTGARPAHGSVFKTYLRGWRRIFDYRGLSSRREYWVFVPITWILFGVMGFLAGAWIFETNWVTVLVTASVLWGFGLASLLASISLTVRRVRDATGSGWFSLLWFVNPLLITGISLCPRRDSQHLDSLSRSYWDVWRKTADLYGYSTRIEFWPFTLINLVIFVGLVVLGLVLPVFGFVDTRNPQVTFGVFWMVLLFAGVIAGILSVPWISLLVRRVRDATGTGLIALIGLMWQVPFLGQIAMLVLLVICVLPSREHDDTLPDTRHIFVRQ